MPRAWPPSTRSAIQPSAADERHHDHRRPRRRHDGRGIAQVAAEAGLDVIVHDPVEGATERARRRIQGFLERRSPRTSSPRSGRCAGRGSSRDRASRHSAVADLVVEAIPEEIALKRDAFRRLDAVTEVSTILATNTSSLSVARIAAAASDPGRVVGMHFFNPVPLMALVEVVPGRLTSDRSGRRRRAARTTPRQDAGRGGGHARVHRQPRAARLLSRGVSHPGGGRSRDRGHRRCHARHRLPAGPVRARSMSSGRTSTWRPASRSSRASSRTHATDRPRSSGAWSTRGASGARPRPATTTTGPRARAGRPGQCWRGRAAVTELDAAQIEARILAAIVNEAASAVADGVATPEAIDTAMRLGTNWPDGPLAWGERIGLPSVVHTLDALHAAVPDGAIGSSRSCARCPSGGSFFARSGLTACR